MGLNTIDRLLYSHQPEFQTVKKESGVENIRYTSITGLDYILTLVARVADIDRNLAETCLGDPSNQSPDKHEIFTNSQIKKIFSGNVLDHFLKLNERTIALRSEIVSSLKLGGQGGSDNKYSVSYAKSKSIEILKGLEHTIRKDIEPEDLLRKINDSITGVKPRTYQELLSEQFGDSELEASISSELSRQEMLIDNQITHRYTEEYKRLKNIQKATACEKELIHIMEGIRKTLVDSNSTDGLKQTTSQTVLLDSPDKNSHENIGDTIKNTIKSFDELLAKMGKIDASSSQDQICESFKSALEGAAHVFANQRDHFAGSSVNNAMELFNSYKANYNAILFVEKDAVTPLLNDMKTSLNFNSINLPDNLPEMIKVLRFICTYNEEKKKKLPTSDQKIMLRDMYATLAVNYYHNQGKQNIEELKVCYKEMLNAWNSTNPKPTNSDSIIRIMTHALARKNDYCKWVIESIGARQKLQRELRLAHDHDKRVEAMRSSFVQRTLVPLVNRRFQISQVTLFTLVSALSYAATLYIPSFAGVGHAISIGLGLCASEKLLTLMYTAREANKLVAISGAKQTSLIRSMWYTRCQSKMDTLVSLFAVAVPYGIAALSQLQEGSTLRNVLATVGEFFAPSRIKLALSSTIILCQFYYSVARERANVPQRTSVVADSLAISTMFSTEKMKNSIEEEAQNKLVSTFRTKNLDSISRYAQNKSILSADPGLAQVLETLTSGQQSIETHIDAYNKLCRTKPLTQPELSSVNDLIDTANAANKLMAAYTMDAAKGRVIKASDTSAYNLYFCKEPGIK